MPNDSFIIRCKICGEGKSLFSYYPSQFDNATNDISNFVYDHLETCHAGGHACYAEHDLPDDGFELHTEGSWIKAFGKVDYYIPRRPQPSDDEVDEVLAEAVVGASAIARQQDEKGKTEP